MRRKKIWALAQFTLNKINCYLGKKLSQELRKELFTIMVYLVTV